MRGSNSPYLDLSVRGFPRTHHLTFLYKVVDVDSYLKSKQVLQSKMQKKKVVFVEEKHTFGQGVTSTMRDDYEVRGCYKSFRSGQKVWM